MMSRPMEMLRRPKKRRKKTEYNALNRHYCLLRSDTFISDLKSPKIGTSDDIGKHAVPEALY
jgi:hypothetical protein